MDNTTTMKEIDKNAINDFSKSLTGLNSGFEQIQSGAKDILEKQGFKMNHGDSVSPTPKSGSKTYSAWKASKQAGSAMKEGAQTAYHAASATAKFTAGDYIGAAKDGIEALKHGKKTLEHAQNAKKSATNAGIKTDKLDAGLSGMQGKSKSWSSQFLDKIKETIKNMNKQEGPKNIMNAQDNSPSPMME